MPTNNKTKTRINKIKISTPKKKIRTVSSCGLIPDKDGKKHKEREKERISGENNQQKRQQQRFSCWNYVAIMDIVCIEMAVKSFFFRSDDMAKHRKTRKCFSFTRLGIVFVFYFSCVFFFCFLAVWCYGCFVRRSMLGFSELTQLYGMVDSKLL